tara:strand:+ start:2401 stop:4068 length:1668 start_codon:yes stop_codon:yes gene_type:complete
VATLETIEFSKIYSVKKYFKKIQEYKPSFNKEQREISLMSKKLKQTLLKTIGALIIGSSGTLQASAGDTTEILIRSQDDETLAGHYLTVKVTEEVINGPETDKLRIIAEGVQSALKDAQGNFLEYQTNSKKEIPPQLRLVSFESDHEIDLAKVEIMLADGAKKFDKLEIKIDRNRVEYLKRGNFRYDLILTGYNQYSPRLEPLDASGRRLKRTRVTDMPFFDSVSVFGTLWTVMDLCRQDLRSIGQPASLRRWENRSPLNVYPFCSEKQYQTLYPKGDQPYRDWAGNAFYHFTQDQHVLCFFPHKDGDGYTSQSFDIPAHEGGHYILSILRPDLKEKGGAEIRAFDETFADVGDYFAILSFKKLREKIIDETEGNLHKSSFLSVMGESVADRDASRPSDTSSPIPCEREHDLSEPLTRAIYGTLADAFLAKQRVYARMSKEALLKQEATLLRKVFLEATLTCAARDFNFANFGREMERVSFSDGSTSHFSGYFLLNFAKHGIDLNNQIYRPLCEHRRADDSSSAGGRQKGICVTQRKAISERAGRSRMRALYLYR